MESLRFNGLDKKPIGNVTPIRVCLRRLPSAALGEQSRAVLMFGRELD